MPWCIHPFFIAPVLAGETMKNLLLQARVVTDPVKNPLIGWWTEFFVFYVKLRDLELRDSSAQLLLDPPGTTTARDALIAHHGGTGAVSNYYYSGGAGMINWGLLCEERVVNTYFRNREELYGAHTLIDTGGVGLTYATAQIMTQRSVTDSLIQKDAWTAVDVANVDLNASGTISTSEIATAMAQWEMLKAANLMPMTFEDYLGTFGIRPREVEDHKPELVRYIREWQYPSNTIDPTNGTPRSAVSWSVAERADKDRRFREPGFLFGLWVTRPKVYFANLTGTFSSAMNDYATWLPTFLSNNPEMSRKAIADNVGPAGTINSDADGYMFDVKDLLLYGEEFRNFPYNDAVVGIPAVALPDATFSKSQYYPALADALGQFVDATAANKKHYIKADGTVHLTIAGSVHDTSPTGGIPLSSS